MPLLCHPAVLACLTLLTPAVGHHDRGDYDAAALTPAAAPVPVEGAVVVARARGRGVPSLMWTPRSEAPPASRSVEAAARLQLTRHADAYGITSAVVAHARTLYVHDTGRGGIIVALRPTVAGVDLVHGDVKLLLDRSRKLLAISGSPHPGARPEAARPFRLTPEAAVLAAVRDLHGDVAVGSLVERSGPGAWRRYDLVGGRLQLREPARVRPVYVPDGDLLLPAYLLELQTRLGEREDIYQYIVTADDGRLWLRHDAKQHAHQYRVYADPVDKRPLDGPLADFSPHPTKNPDDAPEGLAETALLTIEGLNTNHEGAPDPWLPPGATETVGNNVDAYIDRLDQYQNLTGRHAKVTAPGVFDHTYDVAAPAMADDEQFMAALTQVFYTANWIHDWWYDSGFVEATGAAQTDNYGRGGEADDPLKIETQNGAVANKRDNAYISVPLDGSSPRMELLLFGADDKVVDLSAQPLGMAFPATLAEFGERGHDLTAPLVLVDDGAGMSPTDGCEPPVNDVQDRIVLIDRGGCSDRSKVERVQQAGAAGAILVTASGSPLIGDSGDPEVELTIPCVGINKAFGDPLKAALADEPQTVHMAAVTGHTRDSALNALMIQHESGHLMHRRLATAKTAAGNAISEGWGDFLALLMSARAGDDLDGVFLHATWVPIDNHYFGFRRAPYSTDVAYNALTFRHISDGAELPDGHPIAPNGDPNSARHNAGEIWTEMMWEGYVALQKRHAGALDFEAVRRRMSDYVVAGMMLAPVDATYTEQRDALLMAAAAADPGDMVALAQGFARRGAGSCAVSPPRDSEDLAGVVEDYEVRGRAALLGASLGDGVLSCDGDGVVDGGERGRLEVAVANAGPGPLPPGTTLEVIDPPPGLVFPDGLVVAVPELAPLQQETVTLAVSVADGLAGPQPVALRLRLDAPGSCGEAVERTLRVNVQADLAPAGATGDDVEAGAAWTLAGDDADHVWSRELGDDGHSWRGADRSLATDTALTSPPLVVAEDENFTIRFDHAYRFSVWDGGVIELSEDDGVTWYDILDIGDPGYTDSVLTPEHALAGRRAFMGASPEYPALKTLTLPLGKRFAGQTVRVRFRVGTSVGFSADGWTLDNLQFAGITNAPFPQWIDDAAGCVPGATTGGDDPTTGGPGGAPTSTSGTDAGATDSAGGPAGEDADAGCGCVADPRGAGWLGHVAPFALLAWGRRRRPA